MPRLTSQHSDFSQWYLDVIAQADLAENADVRGCIIFKPYGYALWENMQRDLDVRIKGLGVQNAYFPLFIPESLLNKEKEHVEGFAPQCAVVTHGGGKELTEKLYIRPTSETVIYTAYSRWVHSHRDLPIKLNQWANVVRWEMRTRPFLRTLEFLWQEGHTCHATKAEADRMTEEALAMYAAFDSEFLALPVLTGRKPEHEKFAGALYTLCTEALARDGKAIQAGTSHNLGQGFSEAYDVEFLDAQGQKQRPWMTSWGVSTRLIGTLIVVHGDEKGLRLPPTIAPIQVVIVPIYKTDVERAAVLAACHDLTTKLKGIRVHLDDRDEKSPGFKFNEWEVKGVPVRLELGPKDLEKKQVMVVRRDDGSKTPWTLDRCTKQEIEGVLAQVQSGLFTQAQQFLADHTHEATSYAQLQEIIAGDGGFVWAPWDGTLKTAQTIQEDSKASIRMLGPDDTVAKGKKDLLSGADAKHMALFAKAY